MGGLFNGLLGPGRDRRDNIGHRLVEILNVFRRGRLGLDEVAGFFEPGAELGDERLFPHSLGQRADLIEKIFNNCGLSQEAGRFRRVGALDKPAGQFRSLHPSSQGHQRHKAAVFLLEHVEFYLVLSCFELFAQRIPIVVLGKIVDAVAATQDTLAHVEFLGEIDDLLADVFYALAVLRLYRDVAVGHEGAKDEGNLRTAVRRLRCARANKLLPIRATVFVNRGEEFARHRYGYRFNANNLLDLFRRHSRLGSLQTHHGQGRKSGQQKPSNPIHWSR